MTEKTIYVANDGKEFASKEECQDYEASIFASNEAAKCIYFFKGDFNLDTSISQYVESFQFVGGNPIYQKATNENEFIHLFHECNVLYIENKEAVNFLKEIIDNTDLDSFGIGIGVNVWSNGEWHSMNEEIRNIGESLRKIEEINEFFSSLDSFIEA